VAKKKSHKKKKTENSTWNGNAKKVEILDFMDEARRKQDVRGMGEEGGQQKRQMVCKMGGGIEREKGTKFFINNFKGVSRPRGGKPEGNIGQVFGGKIQFGDVVGRHFVGWVKK